GGHSLLAAQLATRVERSLGIEISLRSLFESPTLAAFAADLAAAGGRPEASAVAERPADAAPAGRTIPRLAVRPDPLPLSFAQSRLWVLDRLDSEEGAADPTYHIPAPLRVRGRFDAAAMKAALEGVVARHETLRTTFAATDDGPVQLVAAAGPVALPRIDLSACAAAVREGELERVLIAEAARPFSLARGPLLRAVLARLSADDHALLLNLHHIVSDGWSSSILVAESAALYAAAAAGRPGLLPPLPIQYADFAVWQRGYLAGAELERQLGFWREALAGAPPELPLPFDRPRPRPRSLRGGQAYFELPPATAEALRTLAREERATPFMLLLAAWGLFLGRYAGVSDLVIGTPIANRNRAEITGLIGFFVNTLAIRLRLGPLDGEAGEPSFRDLVRRARRAALDAFAHQDLPFERLVEELQPDRNLGVSPIFQTILSYLNTPEPKLEAAGLTLAMMDLPFAPPKFDLSIGLADRQGRFGGAIEYALDLFDRETAERWSGVFVALIGRAMADPDRPARDVAALDEVERRQVLIEWNPAADPRGEPLVGLPFPSLPELFRAQAAATPLRIAVRRGGEALTYAELDARSDRLARRLVALGARPETLVGVCLPREVSLIVALLAVLKSGAAYLPLDPAYPPERLAFMLEDAGSRLLIGDPAVLGRLAAALAARDSAAVAAFAALTIVSPEPSAEDLGDPRADAGAIALPAPSPKSLAYAIYTSGSTGRPKGVAIEHAQAAAMLAWGQTEFTAADCAGMLASTSVCFDLSVFEIFLPLATGGTVLLAENALELGKVAAWDDCRVRLVNTVPSAMAELVRQGAIPPSVRTICLAGEALPAELLAASFRTTTVERVWNLYGPSEDTTYSTAAEFRRPEEGSGREAERQAAPPIGRAIAGGRAYLLDSAEPAAGVRFELVPAGAAGELFLGGLGVARGYLGRPELTAERFVPDPFGAVPGARLYRTGDLARFRTVGPAPGELLFLGRRDHQLKVRGFRIELGEIEAALRADPRVADAVVVAQVEDSGGTITRLAAYVVPAPPAPPAPPAITAALDPAALRQILAGRLPEAFQPSFWVLLPELPRSPNGKVDRRALPDPALAGAPEPKLDPPTSPLEKLAAKIWSEVLGIDVERIGRQSSFFTLGGHSLLGAQLATRTERLLQVNLPLRVLFEQPTLEGFAAQIAALDAQPGRAEKIARAVLRVQAMSGAQKDALRPVGEPVGA
ncbi:MAG TPA: amino acid adenylation domain-containing protein, partial [Thermoanaerobaculia bacterium]|nr:amino acid adenylation domain-containing protein [Thermoanaerobaculia bacterium]